MTPTTLLLGLEASAFNAYHENLVPVEAAMVSHVFADGRAITVTYSPEEGWGYSFSDTVTGLRGLFANRDVVLYAIEYQFQDVAL